MELRYKLLDHPFYRAWTCGEITIGQLTKYHKSYSGLISEIPDYWQTAVTGLNVSSPLASRIIREEIEHIELWEQWGSILPEPDGYPSLIDVNISLNRLTPSELLGALHAFEIQQPEVSRTKKNGLIKHYGFFNDNLKYFDEHMNEQEHIEFGIFLSENFADMTEFENGINKGSEIFYKALDNFL